MRNKLLTHIDSKLYFLIKITIFCFCILSSYTTFAETKKEYKLADDLFEYFSVTDYQYDLSGNLNSKIGAFDTNGSEIVPVKFDLLVYHGYKNDDREGWFNTYEEQSNGQEWVGAYSKDGICLVPTHRQFTYISKDITEGKEYFNYRRGDREVGICDASGKILANLKTNKDAEYLCLMQNINMYMLVYKSGEMEFYDYSLNSLGNDANAAAAIAKNKGLKKPLDNSPSKSTDRAYQNKANLEKGNSNVNVVSEKELFFFEDVKKMIDSGETIYIALDGYLNARGNSIVKILFSPNLQNPQKSYLQVGDTNYNNIKIVDSYPEFDSETYDVSEDCYIFSTADGYIGVYTNPDDNKWSIFEYKLRDSSILYGFPAKKTCIGRYKNDKLVFTKIDSSKSVNEIIEYLSGQIRLHKLSIIQ